MNGEFDSSFLDAFTQDPGAYGQPGYGVLMSSANQPAPFTDFSGMSPGSIGQGLTPDQFQQIAQAVASDPSSGTPGSQGWLANMAKILTGAGGFLSKLGPGLTGAANIASQALGKGWQYPPHVQAPSPGINSGVAQPLKLAGDAPILNRDPMADYLALVKSLR